MLGLLHDPVYIPHGPPKSRVKAVLDVVVGFTRHVLADLNPTAAQRVVELEEGNVVLMGPGRLLNSRVKLIVPPA